MKLAPPILLLGLLGGLSGEVFGALRAAASAVPQQADGQDPRALLTAARTQFLADLAAFSNWCSDAKLFGQRDAACEAILVLEPDDADAHRALKHKLSPEGKWIAPAKRAASKDYKPALVEEALARRREVAAGYSTALVELHRLHGAKIPEADLDAAFDAVLVVNPLDPTVHEARGEVLAGEAWILQETARARETRARIAAAIQGAMAEPPPLVASEMREEERRWGLALPLVRESTGVRILGDLDEDEARTTAALVFGAQALFRAALSFSGEFDRDFTVYVSTTDPTKQHLCERVPQLAERGAEQLAVLWGAGVGQRDLARWDPERKSRLDAVTRHALALYLDRAYALDHRAGWAFEGFGLYLTRLLTGTRASIYIGDAKGELDGVGEKLEDFADPARNWLSDAYRLLGSETPPDLVALLQKPLSDLTVEDRVIAYAFVAFCVEAHSAALPGFLRALAAGMRGGGNHHAAALEKAFGADPARLRKTMIRWLEERQ